MRKIILFICLVVSFHAFGQTPPGYQYRTVREKLLSFMIDSSLHLPSYCGTPSGFRGGSSVRDGMLAIDTCNDRLFIYSGGAWIRLANFSEIIGASDTATMLLPYLRGATSGFGINISGSQHKTWLVDSFSVATRARVKKQIDSLAALIGGSVPGIDDVLAVSQSLTTTRSINANSQSFTINNASVWGLSTGSGNAHFVARGGGVNSGLVYTTINSTTNYIAGIDFLSNTGDGNNIVTIAASNGAGNKTGNLVVNDTAISIFNAANTNLYVGGLPEVVTDKVLYYNTGNGKITYGDPSGGGGSGTLSRIGSLDSLVKVANGSQVSGVSIINQTADATYPGLLSPTDWNTFNNKTNLSALDTLINPIWDVVQDPGGTTYKARRKPVYNVKDFGVVADNSTDAQPGIQRAIDSAFFHRDEFGRKTGGTVYIPSGMYALTATAASGMHLKIPYSSVAQTDTAVVVEIVGENGPVMFTNPLDDGVSLQLPPVTGSILRSTLLSNTAIIKSETPPFGFLNFTRISVKNIGLRVRSKTGATHVAPQGSGLDGGEMAYQDGDNIRVDTESPRDSTIEPTSTAKGIVFPPVNNWCQNTLTNSLVTGFYDALTVGEHFKSYNNELDGNVNGLVLWDYIDHHPITISNLGMWRNRYNIKVQGGHVLSMTQAVFEDDTTGTPWFKNIADIYEPTTGVSTGTIGFTKVISYVGRTDVVTRTNPNNSFISTYPLASGMQYTGYGRGLLRSLDTTIAGRAEFQFQATGQSNASSIGTLNSVFTTSNAFEANDFYISGASGKMLFHNPGGVMKFAAENNNTTAILSADGLKIATGTYGAKLGYASTLGGLWLGANADATTTSNFALLRSGNQLLINDANSGGMVFETAGGFSSAMLYDANKRLGLRFAYNGTPTAKLHIGTNAGTANDAPIKIDDGTLMSTAEAGAIERKSGIYDTKASGLRMSYGGVVADFYTDVNNSGTSETDIYTYTTPASTLAATGEKIEFSYTINLSDITATAQIQVYFAGASIGNTGALTVSATGAVIVSGYIIRTGSSTARASVSISSPTASTAVYTSQTDLTGLTFTNTNILKVTGTAGGAGGGSSDITGKLGWVRWFGAAAN